MPASFTDFCLKKVHRMRLVQYLCLKVSSCGDIEIQKTQYTFSRSSGPTAVFTSACKR